MLAYYSVISFTISFLLALVHINIISYSILLLAYYIIYFCLSKIFKYNVCYYHSNLYSFVYLFFVSILGFILGRIIIDFNIC